MLHFDRLNPKLCLTGLIPILVLALLPASFTSGATTPDQARGTVQADDHTGLTVTIVQRPPRQNIKLSQHRGDTGGNMRIRFFSEDRRLEERPERAPVDAPWWRPRDRDIGQVFRTDDQGYHLKAVTLKTGPEREGPTGDVGGAPVFFQLMAVTGKPTIHDNGTTKPFNNPYITWTDDPRSDDYIEGVRFTHLTHFTGYLPEKLERNQYLRWELPGEGVKLEPDTWYAFVVGFVEPGKQRGLALANWNRINVTGVRPTPKTDQATFGYAIRRGGHAPSPDGDYWAPNWEQRPELPGHPGPLVVPLDDKEHWNAENWTFESRLRQQPGTWGRPDVDTYRDLLFYLEAGSATPDR